MKSKIIRYLRSISQEPFALSNLDLIADGQVVQFPHSLQVLLRDIQWSKGQWKGLIQDIKGNVEWAVINDPSWNPILNERKRMGFKPVPVSILRLERMKPGLGHSTFRKNEAPTLIIHSGIYDNKWLVNASSFGSFLRCPRIIFLKHRGLYQPRSRAAVKGSLIHEFHVSLYQNLKEEYQSNPSELYELAEIIKEGVIQRAWRDLVSVNLTAKQGRDFIPIRVFVDRMLDAPEFIPWSSEQILSEFWLSSPIFGIQGFVDRLSLLEDGKIAVFELKSGRQPELKVKAAKYQAAAYAMMLLSLGLKISTLIIEFPEAQSPREERFIMENLFPRYFDQIPKMRNGIYHLQTSQEYSWFVFPWKNCNKACFIKRACQFYCYFENYVTKTVDKRCSSKACQFLSVVRAGDYYCLYPKIMSDYPISLDLIDGYLSWYRRLLLEEKQSIQEEINNVILPAFEREKSGNALADMEFVGRDEFSPNVFVFRKKTPSSVIEDEDLDQNREAKRSTMFPSLPPTRMQPGDPVLITPMNKLPRSQYSFRGRIYHMTSTNVLIEVDERELTNDFVDWDEEKEKFLSTDSFRIDLLPSVTTIQTQLKAMDILSRAPFDHNLSSLFPNALKLRNLLIFVQKPRFTEISQDVKEEVESLPLNERQKRAILQALRSKDFILIHGPPGSGKTTTICHLISQILLHQKEKQLTDSLKKLPILVTGFTRKSVDNMVTKWQREFAHYGKLVRVGITSSGNESEVDAVSLEKFVENEKKMGIDDSIDLPKKVLEILNSADIIATTAASALTSLLESYQFQTVIVDEAGQCTEPLTIVPLLKGDRFILVGDHIQLPPVVASKKSAPLPSNISRHLQINAPEELKDTSKRIISQAEFSLESDLVNDFDTLELSLFSRLFRKYGSDDEVTIFLNEQYRMHPFIANFASTFYEEPIFSPNMEKRNLREWFNEEFGELFSSKLADLLKETPWRFDLPFIGLDTGEKRWYQDLETLSESAFNLHEARFISSLIIQLFGTIFNLLLDLNGKGQLDEERAFHLLCNLSRGIGVTTPYRTQVMKIKTIFQEQLRSFLNELNLSISDEKIKYIEQSLMIETVDRFQGREKEIMIISLVDSNPEGSISDLLQDDRRLNVAITRAKRKLIVVGNITMLSILPFYQRMRDYLKSIHGLLYV